MQNTMTIKQISELLNKGETTLRRWIKSAKMASLSAKMAEAKKTSKPAEFNLEEIIFIVKSNGNDTLASLLKDNAEKKEINKEESKIEIAIERGIKAGIQAILPFLEKINIQNKPIEKQSIPAIENKTEQKNYKYLTLKIIGENLNPKLKPSQVGRMLFELGYSVQINNSFTPSFRCTKENMASEQSSIYGGTFYAWHKDFIDILQGLLNKETKLF